MKKGTIITLISVAVVLVVLIIVTITSYNGLVDKEENVNEKQSAISVQLQRRADLIPNFVETVKGYSEYEQSTLLAVTEARTAVNRAIESGDPEAQAAASEQLDTAIDVWVNAISEAYPELKSSELYIGLQDELAGTENRIAKARIDYNESVIEYNKSIRKFPKSIFAGMFGFEEKEEFKADESVNTVPEVKF